MKQVPSRFVLGDEMFRKIKKLLSTIKYFFEDEDLLFLYLLKMKALECMDDCRKLEVGDIEELEDLIFHIESYKAVPSNLVSIKYPEFKGSTVQGVIKSFKSNSMSIQEIEKYGDFLIDVETQRAVERDIIFDHAKKLPFGFSL